jgi:FkbM family methyltransferase
MSDLIFDVGANNGDDTAAYLRIAHRVVAVEANPALCEDLRRRFAAEIASERVFVVNRAVDRRGGSQITLRVSTIDHAQGTAVDHYAERAAALGGDMIEHVVKTISLDNLIAKFGQPEYIKIDIEGMDVEALSGLSKGPRYISIERPNSWGQQRKAFQTLAALGYKTFQIVDQVHGHSGPFGSALRADAWMTCREAILRNLWILFRSGVMRRIPLIERMAMKGRWFDLHASK